MNDEVKIPDGGNDSMPARRGVAVASPFLGIGGAALTLTPVAAPLALSPVVAAVVLVGLPVLGLVCGTVGLFGAWKAPAAVGILVCVLDLLIVVGLLLAFGP